MNTHPLSVLVFLIFVTGFSKVEAQTGFGDNRQEYVRSSSPTKTGGRVVSESIGGRTMVRIARAPGDSRAAARDVASNRTNPDLRDSNRLNQARYEYPEKADSEQVTAFRQAANQPPQLRFPTQNRLAQCNCNGVPVPPQQLGYFPQNTGFAGSQGQPGFQPQTLQPQTGFPPPAGAQGYPLQPGIGVPQFNQTGGNWWTPFVSGSGYYTPLINFRNMPQGTYLGQGIIGQPTAYVDGQPLRNLLRYISP